MIFSSLKGIFKEKYFENSINYWDILKLTRYYFPKYYPSIGFFKRKYYTLVTDLTESEENIFSKFKKTTRYKINRGKREKIVFEVEKDLDIFLKYYNHFAKSKNLEPLKYQTLLKYQKNMLITKAIYYDKILVMHVHIYNTEVSMLLFSASHFRNTLENKEKNLISYANLFLHYEDMLFFKKEGCSLYDFGGYAYGTKDKSFMGINHFKELFNPILTIRYIYTSWTLELIVLSKKLITQMGIKVQKL